MAADSTSGNDSGRTPKYKRIYREIREELRSGYYPVGSRLPTESEFAERFGVSRGTIRLSLDRLVQDRFLRSKQGSGYQVVALSPGVETCLTSFTDAILHAGRKPGAKFVSIRTLTSDESEPAPIHPGLASEEIGVITRVRTVDDKPVFLVRTYLRARAIESAKPEDFPEKGVGQAILTILRQRFHMNWASSSDTIRAALADEEAARELGIEVGAPVLLQSCTATDEAGSVVFHEIAIRHGTLAIEHLSVVQETGDTLSPSW